MRRPTSRHNRTVGSTKGSPVPRYRLRAYSTVRREWLTVDKRLLPGEEENADWALTRLVAAIGELKVEIATGYDKVKAGGDVGRLAVPAKEAELANLRNAVKLVWHQYTSGSMRRGLTYQEGIVMWLKHAASDAATPAHMRTMLELAAAELAKTEARKADHERIAA